MMIAVDDGDDDVFRSFGHAWFPNGDQGDPGVLIMIVQLLGKTINVNFRIDLERRYQASIEFDIDSFDAVS